MITATEIIAWSAASIVVALAFFIWFIILAWIKESMFPHVDT